MDFVERAARNEEIFRNVNREIKAAADRHHVASPLPFHCECHRASCVQTVAIASKEYERVTSVRYRFVVIAGHESAQLERVVEEHETFLIVEKTGEARKQIDRDHPEERQRK